MEYQTKMAGKLLSHLMLKHFVPKIYGRSLSVQFAHRQNEISNENGRETVFTLDAYEFRLQDLGS